MKSISGISVLYIVLLFMISGCKKEDKCTAGLGGEVTLVTFLEHHHTPIINKSWYLDTIYLKFNTKDSPGTNLASFDTYFVGEAGEDHVHIEGLKCGDYYIYGVGFDTTINQRVTGGIPYTITQTSGEVEVDVPVVE